MASKAELKGLVTLNSSVFKSKMRRLRRTARRWGKGMREAGMMAAKSVAVATAAVSASAVAIFKLANQTANAGDAFEKMALRTGISAQALSEYAFVAQITGTNQEAIQKGMKGLASTISYAKDGLVTYTREFDKLGITMDQLDGKSPQEAFETVIGAIGELPGELERSAVAQRIFGRSGQELLPMMKLGADGIRKLRDDANELAITFDSKAAAKCARFKDALTRLKGAFAGVRNKIVLAFLDEFSGGIERITKTIVRMRKEGTFTKWAATAAQAINSFAASAQIAFITVVEYGKATFNSIKDFGTVAWESLKYGIDKAGAFIVKGMAMMALEILDTMGVVGKILIAAIYVPLKEAEKALIDFLIMSEKLGYVESTGRAAVARAQLLAKDDVKKVKDELKNSTWSLRAELEKQAAKNFDKVAPTIANISERYEGAAKTIADKSAKIRKREAAIAGKIAKMQANALASENKRKETQKKITTEQKKITTEMKKQRSLLAPLRGIFGGFSGKVTLPQAMPNIVANAKRQPNDKERAKLEQEQLRVQKLIAENTARGVVAFAW